MSTKRKQQSARYPKLLNEPKFLKDGCVDLHILADLTSSENIRFVKGQWVRYNTSHYTANMLFKMENLLARGISFFWEISLLQVIVVVWNRSSGRERSKLCSWKAKEEDEDDRKKGVENTSSLRCWVIDYWLLEIAMFAGKYISMKLKWVDQYKTLDTARVGVSKRHTTLAIPIIHHVTGLSY